jgi:hypothetical protein
MQKAFVETLVKWPKCFLTGTDLTILLDKTYNSRHAVLKRFAKEGLLTKLQNDLYLITPSLRHDLPNAFELAQFLWGPSYISFESALSYWGWIPEAVLVTSSACAKRGKTVTTAIGMFSFEHIPIDAFSIGIHHQNNEASFLIAHPWKAISDMIYTRRKTWQSLDALQADLRLDEEKLEQSDTILLQHLQSHYPSPRTRKILRNFSL